MRFLKYLLATLLLGIAVVGGLVTVALVAITTATVLAVQHFQDRHRLSHPNSSPARENPQDAIDIVATEVRTER